MPTLAVDSSVLVAAHLPWHEHHREARSALDRALGSGAVIVPFPALLEAYSVMTRMPRAYRVPPRGALELLETTWRGSASLVALDPTDAWSFLADLADRGVVGGAIYDAQVLACAVRGGAEAILTLNRRDFERLNATGLEILCPLRES